MDVILLEKVANLGSLGDKVKVKAGYGVIFCCLMARLLRQPLTT